MNLSDTLYNLYSLYSLFMLGYINAGYVTSVIMERAARLVVEFVGYSGQIKFDRLRPDGALQKLIDSTKLNALGWYAKVGLKEGLQAT